MFVKDIYHYWIILRSGLFDRDYYRSSYPEIDYGCKDLLWHFLRTGWREGKNPSEDFDTSFYLRTNKDVQRAGFNPLLHYIIAGKAEGRRPNQSSQSVQFAYNVWIEQNDILSHSDEENIKRHIKAFSHQPLISILLSLQDPTKHWLEKCLTSIHAQLYSNWELLIHASPQDELLVSSLVQKHSQNNQQIKLINTGSDRSLAENLFTLFNHSSGEYVCLIDQGTILRVHTLYLVANEINKIEQADVIYGDEDLIDEKENRHDPFFKPAWNPDLLSTNNYLAHLTVYKSSTFASFENDVKQIGDAPGWTIPFLIETQNKKHRISHIPFILSHLFIGEKPIIFGSQLSLAEKFAFFSSIFKLSGNNITISYELDQFIRLQYPLPDDPPLVSIIIPTKNRLHLLRNCIDSIISKTHYSNFEVLVVNNQSDDPETLVYLQGIGSHSKIKVLDYNDHFNYSAINNFGVTQAQGNVILFLNNDTEVINPYWLEELVSQALRPEIGAVGALLWYNDHIVQHAGVILGSGAGGIADHAFKNFTISELQQDRRAYFVQNYSALTGACLAVEKSKFLDVGGFDEQLAISYNDIDLCLRLLTKGYRNLFTPYAELYHHKSASLGFAASVKRQSQYKKERQYMLDRWSELFLNDPAHNPNLSIPWLTNVIADHSRAEKPWQNQ